MWEQLKDCRVILGSQSPRRVELLRGLDIDFEQRAMPDVDESYPAGMDALRVPEHIAVCKAKAYEPLMDPDVLLITADTIVLLDNSDIIGKPHSKDEAIATLHKLSGRTHRVVTGVCLTTPGRQKSFSNISDVTFDKLTDEQIHYYIHKYNPLDKAGAYGIQEWIGYIGIQSISGSFYNVMGLPVHQLSKELLRFFD